MRRRYLGLMAILAAVSACKKPETAKPAPPPASAAPASAAPASSAAPAFAHDAKLDVFGYYLPTTPVAAGAYALTNLSIGGEDDFKNWESNHRLPSYGPVMLEFADTSSGKTTSETGATSYAVTERVLPDSYKVDSKGVSFTGRSAKLGLVSFDGRFDAHAYVAAKGGEAPDAVVLAGTLTVGAKRFPDTRFTWFGGD